MDVLNARRSRWNAALSILVPLVWLLILLVRSHSEGQPPVVPDAVQSELGWADEQSCVTCHAQGDEFFSTGHANTLQLSSSAGVSDILDDLRTDLEAQKEGIAVQRNAGEVEAVQNKAGSIRSAKLDWCVGSGHHARTWIGTMPGSTGSTDLMEFRWTHFTEAGQFDVTPGQPKAEQSGFFGGLGVLFDGPRAQRCFGCHASFLPIDHGHLDETRIKPGVTCQRCHGPRQEHVASQGQVTLPEWQAVSRDDSVRRCGQCHRNVDEVDPETIVTSNRNTIRFQPVGLAQSECFQKSEMRCTTCHDPHRTMASQDSKGIWQCLQCHSSDAKEFVLCSAGRDDDCLACHMPKVQLDSPLLLTDHWIRIRKDDE